MIRLIFVILLFSGCSKKKQDFDANFLDLYEKHHGTALLISKAGTGVNKLIALGEKNKSPLIRELSRSLLARPEAANLKMLIEHIDDKCPLLVMINKEDTANIELITCLPEEKGLLLKLEEKKNQLNFMGSNYALEKDKQLLYFYNPDKVSIEKVKKNLQSFKNKLNRKISNDYLIKFVSDKRTTAMSSKIDIETKKENIKLEAAIELLNLKNNQTLRLNSKLEALPESKSIIAYLLIPFRKDILLTKESTEIQKEIADSLGESLSLVIAKSKENHVAPAFIVESKGSAKILLKKIETASLEMKLAKTEKAKSSSAETSFESPQGKIFAASLDRFLIFSTEETILATIKERLSEENSQKTGASLLAYYNYKKTKEVLLSSKSSKDYGKAKLRQLHFLSGFELKKLDQNQFALKLIF